MAGDWRLGYRPELDGLRALAVSAVVIAHAQFRSFVHAGAVGVGVFFVLSGFLITALLLEERRETGRVSLRAFWRRRAARLLPALLVVVTVFLLLPGVPNVSRAGALAIFGYVGNWARAAGTDLEPLAHTWSLAVEEQFYIVWPLAFLGLARLRTAAMAMVIVALAVVSAAARVLMWDPAGGYSMQNQRVYLGTDTNAFLMLAGALLAVALTAGWRVRVSRPMAIGAGVGLVAVAGGLPAAFPQEWWARRMWELQFGWSIAPVFVAVLGVAVIAYLATNGVPWLRWGPLVTLGRLSYGVYLWHWPVFKAWEARFGVMRGEIGQTAILFGVTWLFAWASWRWVEQPAMRRWRTRRVPAAADVVHATAIP